MRFLLVCGGTAGHINPALAIAGKLEELMPDAEFLFVGSGREMEKRLVPQAGYELKNITITGFSRGFSPEDIKKNIKTLKYIAVSSKESEAILKEFKPDAVIGTGGYVCYPVLRKAVKLGIPTLMHESNAVPGLTAKILSDKIDKMMVAFPGVESMYMRPDRVIFTGTPVRSGFASMTQDAAKKKLGLENKPLVVSFWGSLGAGVMNEYMADFIAMNAKEKEFNHIHATGGGEAGLEKMYSRLLARDIMDVPSNIDIRPYIDDMDTVMAAADLVLCRAGASTIAELTFMGKPSILVPSPYVTNNHQEKNARMVETAGGAKVLLESDCSGEALFEETMKIITGKTFLKDMAEAAGKLSVRDSASKIAEIILSFVN